MSDYVAAARSFQSELRRRADEIEKARQLPSDIASRFSEAGFYRLCVPGSLGGVEADPLTVAGVIESLGQADGSAAWCIMIGSTTGLVAAYMPPETAKSVFGNNPNLIVAGVFAPRGKAVEDGDSYVVNGRWQWGSGSPNAHMIMGGCVVTRNGEPVLLPSGIPDSRMVMLPAADVELTGNWDVSGLCGTGSQDFAIRNRRVPKAMSVGLMSDRPLDRPLYAFPIFGMLAAGIAAVMLGLARASIDELVALAGGKTPEGHRKPLAARTRTQEDVAEAEATLRSARAFFYESIGNAWNEASKGNQLTLEARRDLRLSATHAARASVKVVDLMYNLGGGTSVYRTSPLQRYFRDVHVASQHMMIATPTMETVGRVLLGLETDVTQL
jgi:alkylation response protein AidB-like acyl-CoA dehydrogenase